jgi:sugar O-acyltransferase (sialic acid O-acetyltransferase NeuD family)
MKLYRIMKKIAFIGSGELSRHIAHYIKTDAKFEVVGFFDDFTAVDTQIDSYKVIGKLSDIKDCFRHKVFDELVNGIGFSRMQYRKQVFDTYKDEIPFLTYVHSTCFVDVSAKIGRGVIIFPNALLYYNSVIEDNVFIQVGSTVTDSTIGANSMISGNVIIAGRAIIGESCNLGVSTTIINDVNICNAVHTGAGTVVIKSIDQPGLYVGVPARKIK